MEPRESIFINRELSWLDFDSRVLACLLYTSDAADEL